MNRLTTQMAASLICLGALISGASADAAFIPVFSTGTTATGALATPGTADVHYSLASAPTGSGAAFVGTNLPSVWVGNTATSQWISPAANASTSQPAGAYNYRTTFSLAGLDATTAAISGQIASDDSVVILLNGATVGSFAGFRSFATFALSSGFIAGVNTLEFIVTNSNITSFNPTGLQVNITSATANAVVPEPASIVLVSLGGIALAGFGLRRRAAG